MNKLIRCHVLYRRRSLVYPMIVFLISTLILYILIEHSNIDHDNTRSVSNRVSEKTSYFYGNHILSYLLRPIQLTINIYAYSITKHDIRSNVHHHNIAKNKFEKSHVKLKKIQIFFLDIYRISVRWWKVRRWMNPKNSTINRARISNHELLSFQMAILAIKSDVIRKKFQLTKQRTIPVALASISVSNIAFRMQVNIPLFDLIWCFFFCERKVIKMWVSSSMYILFFDIDFLKYWLSNMIGWLELLRGVRKGL